MLESLTKASPNKKWTPRELANFAGIGGLGPVFVGTPEKIADEFEEWIDDTDIDGFNLAYAITPGTFEDIVEFVIPELQKRGIFKKEYDEGTLREKLFGESSYLRSDHIGHKYKRIPESIK